VHLGFGACLLLLPVLGRTSCAGLAALALVYNAWAAPRLGLDRAYRRPGEGRWGGLFTYPLAVLILVLFAPLAVAAGGWAVLAAADPIAAAAGTRLPRPRVPRNPRKSLWGTLAAFLAGSAACFGALMYMQAAHPLPAAVGAGAAGAIAEALPLPFDDNLAIAAATAAVLMMYGP